MSVEQMMVTWCPAFWKVLARWWYKRSSKGWCAELRRQMDKGCMLIGCYSLLQKSLRFINLFRI
jgi:hypothetical protein